MRISDSHALPASTLLIPLHTTAQEPLGNTINIVNINPKHALMLSNFGIANHRPPGPSLPRPPLRLEHSPHIFIGFYIIFIFLWWKMKRKWNKYFYMLAFFHPSQTHIFISSRSVPFRQVEFLVLEIRWCCETRGKYTFYRAAGWSLMSHPNRKCLDFRLFPIRTLHYAARCLITISWWDICLITHSKPKSPLPCHWLMWSFLWKLKNPAQHKVEMKNYLRHFVNDRYFPP